MKWWVAAFAFSISFSTTLSQTWKPFGVGLDQSNVVFDFAEYNGDLFVGGAITYSGSNQLQGIARWDGTVWNPVGNPTGHSGIYALALYKGELIVGGDYNKLMCGVPYTKTIARWDGSSWHSLSGGMNGVGRIRAMTSYKGNLYIAGNFFEVDGMSIRHIARWDGTAWDSVCTLSQGIAELFAIEVFNNELYIGGEFWSINGVPISIIAKFDGITWTNVGGGLSGGIVRDFFADSVNNRLYACGSFSSANWGSTICPSNVAYWDGSTWTAVGLNGPDMTPGSICTYNNELYVGFNWPYPYKMNQSGDTLRNIARWDGNDWMPLNEGVNGSVWALREFNGELAVGGGFNMAGNLSAVNLVASWEYTPVSINENAFGQPQAIAIDPNPSRDQLSVDVFNGSPGDLIVIYDCLGVQVLKLQMTSKQFILNISSLSQGVYILRVKSDIWTSSQKFIKQ